MPSDTLEAPIKTEPLPEDSLVNERVTEYLGWTYEDLENPVQDNDYGQQWQPGLLQWFKEAYAYSIGGLDGHDAFFHMINMIKLDLPHVQLVSMGFINTTFLRVVHEWVNNLDLAIAGAASSGKTFPVAVCIIEDWKCSPSNTLSFVCTTSLGASEDRIWGAIVGLWQKQIHPCGTYVAHKYAIVWDAGSDDAQDREYKAAIKAIAIPPGEEGKKAIDTTRGRKQDRVRIVFDELPEMGSYSTQACVNLESNNVQPMRACYIGNSHRHDDAHGEICKPDDPRGFKSIDTNTPKWRTRTGVCIFMHGLWSPNFQAKAGDPTPFRYLTNRESLKKMLKRCHGNRDSIEFYRNAIGFWPDASVSETVLTTDIIEGYGANQKKKWRGTGKTGVAGLDVGFGRGGDLCVLEVGDVGTSIDSRKILQHRKEYVIMPPATGIFEEEIAKQVIKILIQEGIQPNNFGLDISMDGGKIYREIVRHWILVNQKAPNVHAISSMGRPSDRIVSNVDPRKCSDAFDRRVTEYWMMIREGVMTKCITGIPWVDGEECPLVDELCSRTYEIKAKKFVIETKDKMKERIKRSPDRADAFAYMVEMARRAGLMFVSPDEEERAGERREERREKAGSEDGGYESDSWGEEAA